MNKQAVLRLLAIMQKIAESHIPEDNEDFDLCDYIGNYDDVYDMGQTAGRVNFARELLKEFS